MLLLGTQPLMGVTAGAGWEMSAEISWMEVTASLVASTVGVEKSTDVVSQWGNSTGEAVVFEAFIWYPAIDGYGCGCWLGNVSWDFFNGGDGFLNHFFSWFGEKSQLCDRLGCNGAKAVTAVEVVRMVSFIIVGWYWGRWYRGEKNKWWVKAKPSKNVTYKKIESMNLKNTIMMCRQSTNTGMRWSACWLVSSQITA